MEFLASFGIGVISGIVTSMIIFMATAIFHNIISPWYRGFIYRGVILTGEWESILCEGETGDEESTLTLNLAQVGHQLSGDAVILWPQRRTAEHYEFEGFVQDGIILGHFKPADRRKSYFMGTMIKMHPTGRTLEGILSYRTLAEDNFVSTPISWRRLSWQE